MVYLQLGRPNTGLLDIAGNLAQRFRAHAIGIAACQPMQMDFGDNYVSGEIFELDRDGIRKDTNNAEAEFRNALQGRAGAIEWRSEVTLDALSDYLAREARCADLIITGVASDDSISPARRADTGALVMQAGRPVLIVPAAADTLKLERMVVAWKDSRETRRSIVDALPLLKMAAHVLVIELAAEPDLADARTHLEDVVSWLKRHGVAAESQASLSTGDDASRLNDIVQEQGADIIVAGAYGHSRMREWAFGGVTRNLLLQGNCCALVSH
jgi:nucleotide-binding universal stress UspA family protein